MKARQIFCRNHDQQAAPLPLVWAGLLALMLTACATPGVLETSSPAASPGYTLTAAEQKWPCANLTNSLNVHVNKIVSLTSQAKAEAAAVPPTLSLALSRMMNSETEGPALAQARTERVAADAYNDALRAKRCPTVDIDTKVTAALKVAPPPPSKPEKDTIKPLAPAPNKGTSVNF